MKQRHVKYQARRQIDQSLAFPRAWLSQVILNNFKFNPESKCHKECAQQMYADPPNERQAEQSF